MPADKCYPWEQIKAEVLSRNMTMKEASAKFEVPLGTIQARSAREDWFNRRDEQGRLARVTEEAAAAAAKVFEAAGIAPKDQPVLMTPSKAAKAAKETAESMRDELKLTAAKVARKGLQTLEGMSGAAVLAKAKAAKELTDIAAKASGFDTPESATFLNVNFLNDSEEPNVIDVATEQPSLPPV